MRGDGRNVLPTMRSAEQFVREKEMAMLLQGCVRGGIYPVVQEEYIPPKVSVKRTPQRGVKLAVQCIETEEIYESITQAAKAKHVSPGNIHEALDEIHQAGGLHWRVYEPEENHER